MPPRVAGWGGEGGQKAELALALPALGGQSVTGKFSQFPGLCLLHEWRVLVVLVTVLCTRHPPNSSCDLVECSSNTCHANASANPPLLKQPLESEICQLGAAEATQANRDLKGSLS